MEQTSNTTLVDTALLQLGQRLMADGYSFTCVTPATHQRNLERRLSGESQSLRDVLGWNKPFDPTRLLPDDLAKLMQANVIEYEGNQLRSTVRFSTLGDWTFLHSGYPTVAADAVFFGPDSYRFAHAIQAHLKRDTGEIRHAVGIGSGTGIGAIVIATASRSARVMAVDINDLALRFTAINVALAGLTNVSVKHSDVLQDVTGTFDLIVANPPYMLDAGERTYRHGGGVSGEGLSLRIIEESLPRLAAGGFLLLYTGVAVAAGEDRFYNAVKKLLNPAQWAWDYQELDPDVFGEQLLEPSYDKVERIAVISLSVTRCT